MATSGSDNFVATRDEIIADALADVGAIGPGATPTGRKLTHASRLLNDLVKSIDADGQFLWRVTRTTLTTVASQANYSVSASYLDVDEPMRFLQSGTTTPVEVSRITRDEYQLLDQSETNRTPSRFYVQKDLTSDGRVQMTIYLWPVPTTSGDTVGYTAFTRGEDFDTGSDYPDFPQAWVRCLKLGLAAALAPAYGQRSRARELQELFEAEKAKQLNNDNERGDMMLIPFGSSGYYGGAY